MAETKPDKPGFLSRLFGRKPDPSHSPRHPNPDDAAGRSRKPAAPPEAMPSPLATGADDLTAAPSTVTDRVPGHAGRARRAELAGADLQPIDGLDPEGGGRRSRSLAPSRSRHRRLLPLRRGVPGPMPATAAAKGWWQRLTDGMRRTSSSLSDSVTGLFTKRKLDDATLEELEDALVQADLGVATAMRITEAVAGGRYDKEIAPEEVQGDPGRRGREGAAARRQAPRPSTASKKPFVILMVGVNGSGKTTTIGKLAQKFRAAGPDA